MKSILLFIIILSVSMTGTCKEGLVIKNLKTGKAWKYEKGSKITYIQFQENEYKTGILNTLLDSTVVIGADTVLLKNIAGIRKKSAFHSIARVMGMPLMLIGSLIVGDGIATMVIDPDSDAGINAFLIGSGVFALGYLPYGLSKEDLNVGYKGDWSIEISKDL